jgi:hypothetical protein
MLVTDWHKGQIVVGKIILENGKLRFLSKTGWEHFMKTAVEGKTFVGENVFDPIKSPRAWLRSLPSYYTGSIVRARLVKSQDRDFRLPLRTEGKCLDGRPPETRLAKKALGKQKRGAS